jgi:hypothetical protein
VSYAFVTYALVVAAVLAYAVSLWRTRQRLAETLRGRSGSNRG